MKIDVVLLPKHLEPLHLMDRAVAVFDVLRATTTMTAALAVGVTEIRLFADVASARAAADASPHRAHTLLIGEERCLPPADFDLGNSPGAMAADHAGKTALMSTTNGTRAVIAAKGAVVRVAAAIVNATAVARVLIDAGRDITLLCAGTGGQLAIEDVLGCGAVIASVERDHPGVQLGDDAARLARRLFKDSRDTLTSALADTEGGRNIVVAGLSPDIEFCAQLDVFDVVGVVDGTEPTVRRAQAR